MPTEVGNLWLNGEPISIRSIDVAQGPGGHGVRLEVSMARSIEPRELGDLQVDELRFLLFELDLQAAADLASEIGHMVAMGLRNQL